MALLLYATTFVAILASSTSKYAHNECRSSTLERCYCGNIYYNSHEYFAVNCTDTNFTDASMLRDIPEETGFLIFNGNNVESLPENIFGDTKNYTSLKVIDMSNNHIKNILGKTFHHVPAVETLILNHNDLKISYDSTGLGSYHHPRVFSNFLNLAELHLTNAFSDNTDDELATNLHDIFDQSNLTKLFKLHLEQNEIKYFKDPKVFCNLPKLTQLYLGNNEISHVDFESIRCLKLQFLDLQNNTIKQLTDTDLKALDILEEIAQEERSMTVDIRGNPIRCSEADGLYNWLQTTKVFIRNKEDLQCAIASGGALKYVNLFRTSAVKHEKLSKAITILLVVLGLVFVSLIAAYGYIHRDKLRHRMSPFLDVVSRKVHYTTIDSQIV